MALTLSVDRVDETGRELLTYGTEDFPIAFFDVTVQSVPNSTLSAIPRKAATMASKEETP